MACRIARGRAEARRKAPRACASGDARNQRGRRGGRRRDRPHRPRIVDVHGAGVLQGHALRGRLGFHQQGPEDDAHDIAWHGCQGSRSEGPHGAAKRATTSAASVTCKSLGMGAGRARSCKTLEA